MPDRKDTERGAKNAGVKNAGAITYRKADKRENSKILGVSARTKRSQINFERHIYRIRIRIGTIYSGLSKVTSRTTMAKNKDKFDEGFQYDLG